MLFELHVTVDHDQFLLAKQFCLEEGVGCILVKNDRGVNPWQLIITKWTSRDTYAEAIQRAKELAGQLQSYGLNVLRTKVEVELAHVSPQYTLLPDQYFEFHIKIPMKSADMYRQVTTLGAPHRVIWSALVQSKNVEFIPISTLRFKTGSVAEALDRKFQWIVTLNAHNIHLNAKMHQELCIYDDNVAMDTGWDE